MIVGVLAVLAIAIVGNAMATPAERDEARQRMDRIGKPLFAITLLIVAVWIWMG